MARRLCCATPRASPRSWLRVLSIPISHRARSMMRGWKASAADQARHERQIEEDPMACFLLFMFLSKVSTSVRILQCAWRKARARPARMSRLPGDHTHRICRQKMLQTRLLQSRTHPAAYPVRGCVTVQAGRNQRRLKNAVGL